MLVDDTELEQRRLAWTAPAAPSDRGWTRMYVEHVTQADSGVDLDFLVGSSGDAPGRSPF